VCLSLYVYVSQCVSWKRTLPVTLEDEVSRAWLSRTRQVKLAGWQIGYDHLDQGIVVRMS